MTESHDSRTLAAALFPGATEMARRCREHDWSATSLGPVEGWPASLRTSAATVVASGFPGIVLWGPELVKIYNDGYIPILGVRHPSALGRASHEVWPELQGTLGPMYERALAGETVSFTDRRYELRRGGPDAPPDIVYVTITYVPIRDESGAIHGVSGAFFDTTHDVVGRQVAEERERLLRYLEEERAHSNALLESMSDAYFVLDRDFRYTAVNGVMERNVGLARDRLLGRTLWELFPGAVGTESERAYRQVARDRVEAHFTQHYHDRRLDLLVEVDAYPAADGGVAVFWRDVTGRVRAEAAARRAASLDAFRVRLADSLRPLGAPQAIEAEATRLIGERLDADRVLYATVEEGEGGAQVTIRQDYTRRVAPLLGTFPLAAFGAGAHDAMLAGRTLVVPDTADVGLTPEERATYVAVGIAAHVDVPIVKGERTIGILAVHSAAPRAWTNDEVALLEDVAERTWVAITRGEAEAALRTSEARYRGLFESMDQGFCIVQMLFDDAGRPTDYRFLEANRVFEGQTGLVDAIGRTARDLVPGLEQHWFDTYGRVALTGESTRFQQGSEPMARWFDVYAFRIGEPAERKVAILFNDVSSQVAARKEIERLLGESERARADAEAARAQAESANRAKAQFLATMSHELRTPLNAIGGYAELIELGIHGPVSVEQRADLERIQRSQRHLLGLINGVLNYARVEAGAVYYDVSDVPLDEVLATCEALISPQVRAKGQTFALEPCAPTVRARADREKLQQVVLNLLSNAVKFTDARGHITLSCGANDGTVRVRVADTGRGIPADQLARVFEPFVQVDANLTRTQEGTGLGLAISRDLARGMGGDLTVESEIGVGSVFTLTLPSA